LFLNINNGKIKDINVQQSLVHGALPGTSKSLVNQIRAQESGYEAARLSADIPGQTDRIKESARIGRKPDTRGAPFPGTSTTLNPLRRAGITLYGIERVPSKTSGVAIRRFAEVLQQSLL
jgi:hypothetical protein